LRKEVSGAAVKGRFLGRKKDENFPIFLKKVLAKWEYFYYNGSAWAKRPMTLLHHTPGDRVSECAYGAADAG